MTNLNLGADLFRFIDCDKKQFVVRTLVLYDVAD
jgi:hypothetical protein